MIPSETNIPKNIILKRVIYRISVSWFPWYHLEVENVRGKQLAMDAALADLDRYELDREKRETDAIAARLDEKYGRMDYKKLRDDGYPAGSVVIIGQNLFRNNHYTLHFYRTVLIYWSNLCGTYSNRAYFVQANNDEWPDIPPWADTEGHEGELKDIEWITDHKHWATGEIVEPIETWWMKKWRS